jgi:hypothetical protein
MSRRQGRKDRGELVRHGCGSYGRAEEEFGARARLAKVA